MGSNEDDPSSQTASMFDAEMSRRKFFKVATGTALVLSSSIPDQQAENTDMDTIFRSISSGFDLALAARNPAVRKLLLFPPNYEASPLSRATTFYTPEAFENTQILSYGDSLADGFMDETDETFAPGEYVADIVKTTFGKDWQYTGYARNGSTADYVLYIMEQTDLKDAKDTPSDIILSAGANDIRVAVEKVWDKAEIVLQNPSNRVALEAFATGVIHGIDTYQEHMEQLLVRLQKYKQDGRKINRVFVEGIPDMANAQAIILPSGKSVELNGFLLPRLASNISRLLNNAMLEAIKNTDSHAFDIVFKNNAKVVTSSEIHIMHPTIAGYKDMGALQLKKSIADFPDGKHSFWKEMAA